MIHESCCCCILRRALAGGAPGADRSAPRRRGDSDRVGGMNPFSSATEMLVAIRAGKTTSSALLELHLQRIGQLDSDTVNAVVILDTDRARARAHAADCALARGESWGPLHGLPMTVKENVDVSGLDSAIGDPARAGQPVMESEVLVERLLAAGAIIFGKTNLSLNGFDIQSYNPLYGSTSNPYSLSRTCGGSSGGGAAAVAMGFTPCEIGGDIGGSIRIPASFCGVYGHKPTYGIIPKRGPSLPLVPTDISVRGPLARQPEDLAMLLSVAAGADVANVGAGWKLDMPRPTKSTLAGYNVAVWSTHPACPTSQEIQEACAAVGSAMVQRGASVDYEARPEFDPVESFAVSQKLMASFFTGLSMETGLSYSEWFAANETREQIRRAWRAFFGSFDVLICPSYSMPAFKKNESLPIEDRVLDLDGDEISYWSSQFWPMLTNIAYLPSTTFPAGTGSKSGLPVGLNIVGPEYSDWVTIDVARLLQVECGYGFVAPSLGEWPANARASL